MMLFEDTELFASGNRGRKQFDLPDAEVLLIDNFFTKQESDFYYRELLEQTKWSEYEMEIFDKTLTLPCLDDQQLLAASGSQDGKNIPPKINLTFRMVLK